MHTYSTAALVVFGFANRCVAASAVNVALAPRNNAMPAHRHSVWTLRSSELLEHDPRDPPSVRAQTAIVLTVADALERHPPSSDQAASLREQLVEELARLSSRIEEAGLGVRG